MEDMKEKAGSNFGTARKFSPCLLRYVAVSFALPFVCCLLGFASLFLLNNVFDDLGDFISRSVPKSVAIVYFLAKQPGNLINVMPISALLGASFMTLMLGRRNELTAMRAAGLSLMHCAMPVWVIAFVACITVFAVNESWGPACAETVLKIENKYLNGGKKRPATVFHNHGENRDWTVGLLEQNGESRQITVRQKHQDGTSDFLIAANTGTYVKGEGWIFKDGFKQSYTADGRKLAAPQTFFKEHREAFAESPEAINSHSLLLENMNIRELKTILAENTITSAKSVKKARLHFWHRLTFPLASLIAALFGVALTISTDRMGLMKGFASAVGMLLLFYGFDQLFLVLGQQSWMPPFIGGAAPSLAFLALSLNIMRKKQ